MRGESASDVVGIPRYGIFPIFSHFSHFLARNGWFWGWYRSIEFAIFQYTIEMHRFWLELGVNQLLTMWHSRDMVFSPIFSHSSYFSHFLAENDWFWGWYWSLEFSISQSTIEMYQFWLKWEVNQLLMTYHWRYTTFSLYSSRFYPVSSQNGYFRRW